MAEKLPDQLFVTFKKELVRDFPNGYTQPYVDSENRVGFLSHHQPNRASDEKRKKTQFDWAYGRPRRVYQERPCRVYQDAWGMWRKKGSDFNYTTHQYVPYDDPIEVEYAPQIWENVPIDGFTIVNVVSRSKGNKLFRVEDPRGGQFEITSYALYDIALQGSIVQGKILNKCVWKSGHVLVIA
jgi:hypothetical protein